MCKISRRVAMKCSAFMNCVWPGQHFFLYLEHTGLLWGAPYLMRRLTFEWEWSEF